VRWVLTISIELLCCFFLASPLHSFAQTSKADSLSEVANSESNPDKIAGIYLQIAELKSSEDPTSALDHTKRALTLAGDNELLGDIYDQQGRIYFGLGELENALESFQEAKSHKKIAGNEASATRINNRVGVALLRLKRHQEALEVFLESAAYFEETDNELNLALVHNNMAGLFADTGDYPNSVKYNELALPVFREEGVQQYEIITLTNLAGQYLKLNEWDKALQYNRQAQAIAEELQDQYALGIIYNNFGQIYFEQGEIERSLEYYEQSLEAKQSIGQSSNLVPTYNNLGQALTQLNRPEEAIGYLKKGFEFAQGDELWHITSNLSKAFSVAGEPDSAAHYLDMTIAYRDSIFTIERQSVIDELRTEYETEQQQMEIAQLEASQRQNRNLLAVLTGLLGTTFIIAFLLVKNNRKKRIIAQQNEKLEKQNVEKLLKEQEVIGINAMLEGQDQERRKIAEELHDTIGSSLATLKLYVESLEDSKKQEHYKELHHKTSQLLEQTYDEVRKIAHAKSTGVLIKKGLVPAVESMALKISEARSLKTQVIGTGLEDRLENSLEISIFRTIQELLSNAVKHAKAKELIIQITQFESTLTILVEDDGVGFDPKNIQWGLGYSTIQNRMDKLNGEMTIDSTPGNGTTVILNLPVE